MTTPYTVDDLRRRSGMLSEASLTRKHFIMMAQAIANLPNPADRKMIYDALLPMLMASNPMFDSSRFMAAAKVGM